MTFTFVVAGTSISALCSVLAMERKKGKTKLSFYSVYCHNPAERQQAVSSVNITSSVLGNKGHLSHLIAAGVVHNAATFLRTVS